MRRADSPRTLTSSLSCFHCLPLLLVLSRVHLSGPFKLDIVFRSSGLGTTGRRSVVYIDEEFAQRAAALERLFFKFERSPGRPLPGSSSGRRSGSGRGPGPKGGLFNEAPPGESQPAKEFAATPHKGEHTKGETGFESWWTLLWWPLAPALPP